MDHALRTISYIADIGDVLVIMARRGPVEPSPPSQRSSGQDAGRAGSQGAGGAAPPGTQSQTKICCHVFESEEVCLYYNVVVLAPLHRRRENDAHSTG